MRTMSNHLHIVRREGAYRSLGPVGQDVPPRR